MLGYVTWEWELYYDAVNGGIMVESSDEFEKLSFGDVGGALFEFANDVCL